MVRSNCVNTCHHWGPFLGPPSLPWESFAVVASYFVTICRSLCPPAPLEYKLKYFCVQRLVVPKPNMGRGLMESVFWRKNWSLNKKKLFRYSEIFPILGSLIKRLFRDSSRTENSASFFSGLLTVAVGNSSRK